MVLYLYSNGAWNPGGNNWHLCFEYTKRALALNQLGIWYDALGNYKV